MQPSQFHERKFSRTRPHTQKSKLKKDLRGLSPALEASGKNYNSLFWSNKVPKCLQVMTEALKIYMDNYSLVSIRVTNSRKIELPFSNSPRPREKQKYQAPLHQQAPWKNSTLQPTSQKTGKTLYNLWKYLDTELKPAVTILLARNQILSAIECQCAIFHIKTMDINTFFAKYKQITMRVFSVYV